jgi:hypothetical protein
MPAFQTADKLTEQFRTIMRNRPTFVPKNVTKYRHRRFALQQDTNILGMAFSPEPATGRIVHVDETLIVLKNSPSEYTIVDPALFSDSQCPKLGEKVTLTPYARKSLRDFLPLDASRSDGEGFNVTIIGETRTRLPGKPTEGYLHDLGEQLESLKMPDNIRSISNALADWQACDFNWIGDDSAADYRLSFSMTSPGYTGPLIIRYKASSDTYSITTNDGAGNPTELTELFFDHLGTTLSGIAQDSDSWFRISVTSVQPKSRAA